MDLKLKYLFFRKNFIRSKVRKYKSLIRLYRDYIEYVDVQYQEKLDRKVTSFKTKQYQDFQNRYYEVGNEKEIFDVVLAYKLDELKKKMRLKFRAFRETTRRKIAKLNPETQSSEIETLKQSIIDKEIEINKEVEAQVESWKLEFKNESERRKTNLHAEVSIDDMKKEVEGKISHYRKTLKETYDAKLAEKVEQIKRKIAKYETNLVKSEALLKTASEQYASRDAEANAKETAKKLEKAQKELEKYTLLLEKSETDEEKQKYEKILVTIKDKVESLTAVQPSIQELIQGDEVLAVKDLCMYFGGIKAVHKLNFTVKEKEIFGLIGPNGAGKTTVFNCITQFYKPTSGQLVFRNKEDEIVNLNKEVVHNVILQGIVRTFQNLEVIKEVSVINNLLIAAHRSYTSNLFHHIIHSRILKVEEEVNRARAIKVLDFMGLLKYKDYLAWGLPYGILKKIEIARTLMCNPQLIILDEPAAGLNDSETVELAGLIRRIRDEYNSTILLVEHDMGLVMDVCDRICAISFGNLLALGTPEEIQNNKAVQEAYLGVSED